MQTSWLKAIQIIFCLATFLVYSGITFPKSAQAEELLTVAVLDFEVKGDFEIPDAGSTMAEFMTTSLGKTGKVALKERSLMKKIMQEQAFSTSGLVTNETALKIGQLYGVKAIVSGSVVKWGKVITVNVRLINSQDGSVMKTADIKTTNVNDIPQQMDLLARKLVVEEKDKVTSQKFPSAEVNYSLGRPWVIQQNGSIWKYSGENRWHQVIGSAIDIGVGANGDVWAVGTDRMIYKWNGSGWSPVVSSSANRVAVGPDGMPWGISDDGKIWKYLGENRWQQVIGSAIDIAIGANGDVWVVGSDRMIYKWNGSEWTPVVSSTCNRIAVGPDGTPWTITQDSKIWRYAGDNSWHQVIGSAIDIAIGANGDVWVVGSDHMVYRWNGTGWSPTVSSNASAIAVQ